MEDKKVLPRVTNKNSCLSKKVRQELLLFGIVYIPAWGTELGSFSAVEHIIVLQLGKIEETIIDLLVLAAAEYPLDLG